MERAQYTTPQSIAFLSAQVSAARVFGTRGMAERLELELEYALAVEEERCRRAAKEAEERELAAQAEWWEVYR